MELRQLEAFVSVATLRSFKAAANRLNVTQPAISLRLAALERELGARLFERQGSSVRPTGKGLELLAHAEHILEGAQRIKGVARVSAEIQRVRLGTTSSLVHAWVTDLLEALRDELPHLVVELVVDTTPRLRALLVSGELDVAMIMGPVHEAGLRSVRLRRYRTIWAASPKLAETLPNRSLTLHEIARRTIISHARDSATYGSLEEAMRLAGLWPVQLSSSNSVEAILMILRRGLAIGMVSEACVRADDPSLRILRCELELPSYEYFASYHLDSVGRIGMIVAELARRVAEAG